MRSLARSSALSPAVIMMGRVLEQLSILRGVLYVAGGAIPRRANTILMNWLMIQHYALVVSYA